MLHRLVCHRPAWLTLVVAVGLGACNDTTTPPLPDPPPPPTAPVSVSVVEAPDEGVVNTALADPVVVRATNSDGSPASGATVRFTLTNGGTTANATAVTDGAGLASPGAWTLGPKTGNQRLLAAVNAAPAPINVNAVAGPFAAIDLPPSMEGRAFTANHPTPILPTFVATDEFSNRGGAGTSVTFTALEGTISPTNPKTVAVLANGDARAGAWTLDGTVGPQRLVAAYLVGGVPTADTLTVNAVCATTPAVSGATVAGQWRPEVGADCNDGTSLMDQFAFTAGAQTAYSTALDGPAGQSLELHSSSGAILTPALPTYLSGTTSQVVNYLVNAGSYASTALAPGLTTATYTYVFDDFGNQDGVNDYLPPVGCAQTGSAPFVALKGIDAFAYHRTTNTCNVGGFGTFQDRYVVFLAAGEELRARAIQSANQGTTPFPVVISLRIRDANTAGGAVVVTGTAGGTGGRTFTAVYTSVAAGFYEVIVGSSANEIEYNVILDEAP